jgi:hypothetical protein
MGHVDDAHRAVGDGETKRDKQQNRAETETDKENFKHGNIPPSTARQARRMAFPEIRSC